MQNLMLLTKIGDASLGVLPHYIGDASTSWVDAEDVSDAAAVVLSDPQPHSGQSYLLGAEVASMREIAEALSAATGRRWREERREPEVFFQTVAAAGADPIYMACVRTIFERTGEGTLPDLAETSDALGRLTNREPTSIQSFVNRHRDHFSGERSRFGVLMLGNNPIAVILLATDLQASAEFYGSKLGLEIVSKNQQSVTFRCGGDTRLTVSASTSGTADQQTQASWQVDDLESELAELRSRGVQILDYDTPELATENGIADTGDALHAWFIDPGGNTLGIDQRK